MTNRRFLRIAPFFCLVVGAAWLILPVLPFNPARIELSNLVIGTHMLALGAILRLIRSSTERT